MSDVETKMAFRARAQVQRKRKLSAVFGLGQEGGYQRQMWTVKRTRL